MAKRGAALKAARRQARAEAAVKFNPQQRVLIDALGTARAEEQRAVHSAKGTASALSAAIRRARTPLRQGYDEAAHTASAARGDLLGHLAQIGAPAAPFAAAVAREQAGVTSRAAQERANALGELTLRGVQAQEGRASSIQNAHQQYATDAGGIYKQLIGISQDRGDFTAAQIADIRQAQRTVAAANHRANIQAQTTRRGQNLQHKDRVAAEAGRETRSKRAAAAKANKPRKNKITASASSHAVDQINVAVQAIRTYGPHNPSHTLRQWLLTGQTLQDKNGNKSKVPQIKGAGGISAHDLVNAAYDIATFGSLSRPNRIALRGVHVPAAWKRPVHPALRNRAVRSAHIF